MTIPMLIFGILLLVSAAGVVFAKKPLNSALCLVATLFFVAAHFALIGADFVAALQILIYAGAIMVLVIFVIMLLGVEKDEGRESFVYACFVSIFVGLFLALLVVGTSHFSTPLQTSGLDLGASAAAKLDTGAKGVGAVLFTKYLYPFEVVSLLLLAAMIGAVVLASEKKRPLPAGRGLSAVRKNEEEV